MSVKSVRAIKNLNAMCNTYLAGRFNIEVIDISTNKELAAQYQIIAIPTLIKTVPEPFRTVIGDLSDTRKLLTILEID